MLEYEDRGLHQSPPGSHGHHQLPGCARRQTGVWSQGLQGQRSVCLDQGKCHPPLRTQLSLCVCVCGVSMCVRSVHILCVCLCVCVCVCVFFVYMCVRVSSAFCVLL